MALKDLNRGSAWCEIDPANLTDILLLFDKLPGEVSRDKTWAKFWRHVSKPLVAEARKNAKNVKGKKNSGQLSRSIGFFRTKASKKFLGGYVGPRIRGAFAKRETEDSSGKGLKGKKQYTKSGFYGAFVEYGSEVMFGGKGTGQDQPFMRDAFDAKHRTVLINGMKDAELIFDRAVKIYERRLKKYGKLGF